jgi:hypothetical protein
MALAKADKRTLSQLPEPCSAPWRSSCATLRKIRTRWSASTMIRAHIYNAALCEAVRRRARQQGKWTIIGR